MLENTMTATLNGETIEFDTDFGRQDARRITFETYVGKAADDRAVDLVLSISHHRGGEYTISIFRHTRDAWTVEFRIMRDTLKQWRVAEGSRYSSKKLEEVAAYWFEKLTSSEVGLNEMLEWAKELTA